MNDTEAQQLLLDIIEYAEKGKLTEFRFITSWAEFRHYRQMVKGTKLTIRILDFAAKGLFKTYCKDITTGAQNVNKILAYSQLQNIKAFYERDLDTLKRMIDEYDEYLGQGHFWYSFLGGERILPWNTL